jgi:NAD(P)-dependent dehydrogenase (short-subunit alcohol dehydrogenase family)
MKDVSNDVEILVNQVDMVEEAQIEHMVQAAVGKWGRVDYAVNCAGWFHSFISQEYQSWFHFLIKNGWNRRGWNERSVNNN